MPGRWVSSRWAGARATVPVLWLWRVSVAEETVAAGLTVSCLALALVTVIFVAKLLQTYTRCQKSRLRHLQGAVVALVDRAARV